MYLASTSKFINYHKSQQYDRQRLGQRFCNMYIKGTWPELFYQINETAAARMIDTWLTDNHYSDCVPPAAPGWANINAIHVVEWAGPKTNVNHK